MSAVDTNTLRLGYLVKAFPRISETFIINEVLELEAQGIDLRIYTMTYPRDAKRHRLADRVRSPIVRLPEGLRLATPAALAAQAWVFARAPLRYVATLLRVLAAFDLELVGHFFQAGCLARRMHADGVAHVHAGFVHAPGSVAWLVHELTGRSFSLATHAKDLYHSNPSLLRRKLAAARLVFTCTKYNVDYLRLACEAAIGRVRRIYHGTDLERFRFEPCGLADPPLVLAVARLVEKKGLDDLIRACALLRDRRRRFRCRIIGAGVLRDRLEALIRSERLEGLVTLEGALDQEDVLGWYRQASVVAAPCIVTSDGDRDGIPNALVEAAACGVPIVSTPVSGIPELIDDRRTGLLVPPRNPAALAAAIEELFDDPALRDLLRVNARARVEAELDLRRNAREIGRELLAVMSAEDVRGAVAKGAETQRHPA
jgi:glycosyltransferase involved in cell wall biosynthesis